MPGHESAQGPCCPSHYVNAGSTGRQQLLAGSPRMSSLGLSWSAAFYCSSVIKVDLTKRAVEIYPDSSGF